MENFTVNNQKLVDDIKSMMDKLRQRDEIIKNFAASLRNNGLSYTMIFTNFLGIKNLQEAELTAHNLRMCFKYMKFNVEDSRFDDFIETLQQNEKIYVRDILKLGKKFERKSGVTKEQKDGATKKKRRFHSLNEVYKHIADMINIHKMIDFGPLLKGQDFNDDETITRANLFRTLTSLI